MSGESKETVKRDVGPHEYVDYYRHDFTCGNCGRHQAAYVLRGRSLKGLGIDCDRCGCYAKFNTFSAIWAE